MVDSINYTFECHRVDRFLFSLNFYLKKYVNVPKINYHTNIYRFWQMKWPKPYIFYHLCDDFMDEHFNAKQGHVGKINTRDIVYRTHTQYAFRFFYYISLKVALIFRKWNRIENDSTNKIRSTYLFFFSCDRNFL